MNYMRDRLFFDTNIIYYAFDTSEPAKRKACEVLLEKVFTGDIIGVVSGQVLGELFNASITKLNIPLDRAQTIVQALIISDRWEKINYDQRTVLRAVSNFRGLKVPFWDLMIAETMKENGVAEIVTENRKDFDKIPGIKVLNPFKA